MITLFCFKFVTIFLDLLFMRKNKTITQLSLTNSITYSHSYIHISKKFDIHEGNFEIFLNQKSCNYLPNSELVAIQLPPRPFFSYVFGVMGSSYVIFDLFQDCLFSILNLYLTGVVEGGGDDRATFLSALPHHMLRQSPDYIGGQLVLWGCIAR